jgi:nitrate/nitrite-specific signal transduction histidine kinase
VHQAPEVDPLLQLQILRELTQTLSDKPDINEVCQLVIEGIHRAVGMHRVALLMNDSSRQKLVPKKLGGKGTVAWEENFAIPRDGHGPLGDLLPQAGHFIYQPKQTNEQVDFDQWLGRIPALVAPVKVKGRLIGVVYADTAPIDCVPSQDQMTAFAHFVQNIQLCLTLVSEHQSQN